MAIITDIVETGEASETSDGLTATRAFLVRDIGGAASSRTLSALKAAGIPLIGAPHPANGRLKVTSRQARVKSSEPATFIVTCVYEDRQAAAVGGPGDPPRVEWQTENVTESTIRDRDGNLLGTVYNVVVAATGGGSTSTLTARTHRVDLVRPTPSVRLTRTLPYSARRLNTRFGGRVNLTPWSGYGAEVVRCDGFTSSDLSDGNHQVTGLFVPSPSLRADWKVELAQNVSGTIPSDARLGNGLAVFSVYPAIDFNASGWSIPQ